MPPKTKFMPKQIEELEKELNIINMSPIERTNAMARYRREQGPGFTYESNFGSRGTSGRISKASRDKLKAMDEGADTFEHMQRIRAIPASASAESIARASQSQVPYRLGFPAGTGAGAGAGAGARETVPKMVAEIEAKLEAEEEKEEDDEDEMGFGFDESHSLSENLASAVKIRKQLESEEVLHEEEMESAERRIAEASRQVQIARDRMLQHLLPPSPVVLSTPPPSPPPFVLSTPSVTPPSTPSAQPVGAILRPGQQPFVLNPPPPPRQPELPLAEPIPEPVAPPQPRRSEPERTSFSSNPTNMNKIPAERQSAEFKTKKQLIGDIHYFFKNYKLVLQDEIQMMPRAKTLAQLKELHNRIVGKLTTSETESEGGVKLFIDAEDYINNRIKEIIAQYGLDGLEAKDMVDINAQPGDDENVGSYTIKKNSAGLKVVNRAPVYRAIPTTQPEEKRKKVIHLKTLPTQEWNPTNVANRLAMDNPFIKKQQVNKLFLKC